MVKFTVPSCHLTAMGGVILCTETKPPRMVVRYCATHGNWQRQGSESDTGLTLALLQAGCRGACCLGCTWGLGAIEGVTTTVGAGAAA